MIRTRVRLNNFLSDGEARNRYRKAINELEDLHIFDILREIQSEITSSIGTSVDGKELDLLNYHKMYGYMQALNDIEYLVEVKESSSDAGEPDFGARESLRKEGYTDEEINKMLSGE